MPIRFDSYRFVDGRTPLSAAVFNKIFRDLDARAAALEAESVSWQDAVQTLTTGGLARIDGALGPLLELAESQIAQFPQQIDDAITPLLTQLQEDANTAAQVVASLDPYPSVAITYDELKRIDTVTATYLDDSQEVQTMAYNPAGQLTEVVSVLNGQTQTMTLSYDEDGLVTGLVTEVAE
jgi:YD repeat-containing protein